MWITHMTGYYNLGTTTYYNYTPQGIMCYKRDNIIPYWVL